MSNILLKALFICLLFVANVVQASLIDEIILSNDINGIKAISHEILAYSKPTKNKNTVLIESILKDADSISHYLIRRGVGVNVKNFLGKTPLMIAFQKNKPKAFINLLIDNGASPILKDRLGRDILFYAKTTKDKKSIDLAKKLLTSIAPPTPNDIKNLIQNMNQRNQQEVTNFFNKFKSLNFTHNGQSDADYFIKAQLFLNWGLEYFLERGYELNQKNLLHKVIPTGKFRVSEQLINHHVSLLEKNKEGQIPLMVAIDYFMSSDEFLNLIYERMIRYDSIDNNGNSLLHYAAEYRKCFLIEKLIDKGLSLDLQNIHLKTPSMHIARGNCGNKVTLKAIQKTKNLSAKDKNGNTVVHLLAKNHPRLLIQNFQNFSNSGYDFNSRNNAGKTAIGLIRKRHPKLLANVDIDNINNSTIPSVDLPEELEFPESPPSSELEQVQEHKSHSPSLAGSTKLDIFLEQSVNSLIRLNKANYTELVEKELNQSKGQDSSLKRVQILQEEINLKNSSIASSNTRLNELISLHQAKKAEYDAKLLLKDKLKTEKNTAYNDIRSEINIFNNSFLSLRNEIEQINQFREEFDKYRQDLDSNKNPIQIELSELKQERTQRNKQFNINTKQVTEDFRIKQEIARSSLSTVEVEISDLRQSRSKKIDRRYVIENEINSYREQIKSNKNQMNAPGHINGHKTGKDKNGNYLCRFLHNINVVYKPKIARLNTELRTINAQIAGLKYDIARREKDLASARKAFESDARDLNKDKKDEISKIKDTHTHEVELLNSQIERLEFALDTEIKLQVDSFTIKKSQLENQFGDLEALKNNFLSISSAYSILNSGIKEIQDKKLIVCSGMIEVMACGLMDPEYFGPKNQINSIFYDSIDKISSKITAYEQNKNQLSFINNEIKNIKLYDSEITSLRRSIEDEQRDLEDLKRKIADLEEDEEKDNPNNSLISSHVNESINHFKSTLGIYEQLLSNQATSSSTHTSFADFLNKASTQKKAISFELRDFDPNKDYTQRKLSLGEAKYLIAKILSLAHKGDSNSLLAEAVIHNSSSYLLSQKDYHSLRIDSSDGSFVFNSDGSLIEFDSYTDENFELLSKDKNFNDAAVLVIDKLKTIDKNILSQSELEKYELAFAALKEADKFAYQGKIYESQLALSMSDNIADTIMGITPVLSVGKDAFEVITGKNFITGVKLTDIEWNLALLSMVTIGTMPQVKKLGDIILKLSEVIKSKLIPKKKVKIGFEIINIAQKLKISATHRIQAFFEYFWLSNNDFGIIDLNSTVKNLGKNGFILIDKGSEIRKINLLPSTNPKWGLTAKHLKKHFFGESKFALKNIDIAGTPDKWKNHLAELFNSPVSSTTTNGMLDIIKEFPKANGSGTFKLGIRIKDNLDGTYELVTVLTKQ